MKKSVFFRFAGWLSLLAVLLTVSFFGFSMAAPTSGIAKILAILGMIVLTPVFISIYMVHHSESAVLSIAGLVLWIPAGVLDIASLFNPANTFLFALDNLAFSLPFLIFGFLGYRSAKMSHGVALMALLSGAFYLIAGVASFIGIKVIGMSGSFVGLIFMLVWFILLWKFFSSAKA